MRLFHGSNMEIAKVDLSKCMPNKDFGCGFYTTLLEEQAWRMAQRRARIDGGRPTVTVYEVPDDLAERSDLNCRIFDDKPTIEWAIFIKNNRDRKFTDFSSMECNLDCKIEYTTQDVIEYLIEDNGISMEQAMEQFYMSDTFEKLSDIETGLYLDGSAYVYELLKRELEAKL